MILEFPRTKNEERRTSNVRLVLSSPFKRYLSPMNWILDLYHEINAFGKDQGLKFEWIADGEIAYELVVEERHLATPTVAHGGVMAAFMDCILGVSALSVSSKNGKLVSTLELKISYLEPVVLGDTIRGVGKVIREGNRILFSEGEIRRKSDGVIVARGSGTFNAYPIEKSGVLEQVKKK